MTPAKLFRRALLASRYVPGSRWLLTMALMGAGVAAATEPMISWLVQTLLDRASSARPFPLWLVPASVLTVFGIRAMAWLAAQYATAKLVMLNTKALSEELFQALIHARPSALDGCGPGETASAMVHDSRNGAMQLGQALLSAAKDLLTLIFLFGYLLWLDWRLTAIVVVLLPCSLLAARLLVARVHASSSLGAVATNRLIGIVAENIIGWRTVRLQGSQNIEANRFRKACEDADRLSLKSAIAASVIPPVADLLAASTLAAVVFTSLCLNAMHSESVATLLAFVVSMILATGPMKRLADTSALMAKGVAHLDRATALISQLERETSGPATPHRSHGHIVLRSVTIHRSGVLAPTLSNASLEIQPGQVVALLGPSGVGKTTLVSSFLRFLDLQSGDIELDGTPLKDWDAMALRRQFSVVSDDIPLLQGTVAENVSLGMPLDLDRVRHALKEAALLDYIESLPLSINATIEQAGRNLSLGQRQRMSIARAIYENAPIVILDEPTSALDQHTEDMVLASLNRFLSTRTALVITHRLPKALHVHRVIRLEAGRLTETPAMENSDPQGPVDAERERGMSCDARPPPLDGDAASFDIWMPKQTNSTEPAPAFAEAPAPHLNTALHARIMADGSANPSTYASAMAALERIRRQP